MKPKQTRRDSRPDEIVVKTSAFGITAERAVALARSVTKHRAVVKFLGRSRNRLLSFEILDADFERKPARPTPPSRFRATFFDYTRNRTVYATGNIKRPSAVTVTESVDFGITGECATSRIIGAMLVCATEFSRPGVPSRARLGAAITRSAPFRPRRLQLSCSRATRRD